MINPAKNELGKVSKNILEKVIKNLVEQTRLNLWKNTAEVINWFNLLKNQRNTKFLKFDIVEFYPSITKKLLEKALNFALSFTELNESEMEIIMHTKHSLLIHNNEEWEKKSGDFDVTMGSFDGAETCELIGLYMLNLIQQHVPAHQIGLYRDDGLSIIPNANGQKLDRLRKKITQIFKSEGLKITVEANLTRTDFLDVTFDLESGKYAPYYKDNNTPLYINTKSNHPSSIIKELPNMIQRRLSDISSDASVFEEAKPMYDEALSKSGYSCQLQYQAERGQRSKKSRSLKVIWFNPPFNRNVRSNIGEKFFKITQ